MLKPPLFYLLTKIGAEFQSLAAASRCIGPRDFCAVWNGHLEHESGFDHAQAERPQ
jgi:hypothetical protein